ncbi:small proline-rich protein 2H-like [Bicyclus anynana]|uniref:Small proline-rich protein 2H-like n=1 Tax=Bicyclus anynana TaxID=110368 RepID=A0ABM3M4L4_BICAN|nr:small proline-rich protein 2H-like [Bicyclus anynana]
MGIYAWFFLAIISTAYAAPWRCCKAQDGSTICYGEVGQPTINPPTICVGKQLPPCACPATIYTPPVCPPPPCPSPCPPPPCPQPFIPPCGQPCYV